ncbi:M2 family metallopeptidase [bacterium]|nr:M2 family metallopeptidase [bacterium]
MKILIVGVILIAIIVFVQYLRMQPADKRASVLIDRVVSRIEPLLKELKAAYWKATTTGKKEWYQTYEQKSIELNSYFSDRAMFKELKTLKKKRFKDPIIKRQIELLYGEYLENQTPESLRNEIISRETDLIEKFNTFRAGVDGKNYTDNEIRKVLTISLDSSERKKFWEASKQVGKEVATDLIELVKLRNKAARIVGFKNYYDMSLFTREFDEDEIFDIFKRLEDITNEPFKKIKTYIDEELAKSFNVDVKDLRPWHYDNPFFQSPPDIFGVKLGEYLEDIDVVTLSRDYYNGIGLEVDSILASSDLYEREGKEQHAYCMHMDNVGDVRILANVVNDEKWTSTMLHELGHAVYDKYLPLDLPYLLREPAHKVTTEAIAMLFEKMTHYPEWLTKMLGEGKKDEFESLRPGLEKMLKAHVLIFARWGLVMINFERELYRDPDQNLNSLWWNMVEKYQMVHGPYGRNEPDWAAKIHFATAAVYYQNYVLADILVAQLRNYIENNLSDGGFPYIDNPKLGEYFKDDYFRLGMTLKWNDFIKEVTGEYLNPEYFAKQNSN